MSKKLKFSKLRLPASNRSNTATHISAFFTKSSQEQTKTLPDNEHSKDISSATYSTDEADAGFISLPGPSHSISGSVAKPLFSSFEAIKPSKVRRVDSEEPNNPNTIREFFASEPNENDFESPPQKVVKRATALKKTKQRAKTGASKKQPNIRKALLKREEILSTFIAEQSIAEHIDPDEMQLALALSKSVVETSRVCGESYDDCSNGSSNSVAAIREKLEEFGYKVARKQDGNQPFYIGSKVRTKWANKFTSLTLRNPERQQEKINTKIEKFLHSQYTHSRNVDNVTGVHLPIVSGFLSGMASKNKATYSRYCNCESDDVSEFYVKDLCEPPGNKIGNLLKDFHAIPGRDLSPIKFADRVRDKYQNKDQHNDRDIASKDTENVVSSSSPKTSINSIEKTSIGGFSKEYQNFFREPSPDLFLDEEEEMLTREGMEEESESILQIKKGGEEVAIEDANLVRSSSLLGKNGTIKDQQTQSDAIDIVTLSSESNSNDIIAFEKFSSDEGLATTTRSKPICTLDTLQNLRGTIEENKSKYLVDLTQENLIDRTQADINEEHFEHEDPIPSTSRNSLNLKDSEQLTQGSASSVIILSDDEVNYSIKMANGLDISDQSAVHSEANSLDDKDDSNKLAASHGSSFRQNADGNDYDGIDFGRISPIMQSDYQPIDFDIPDCNNLSPKLNIFSEDIQNYSLAHEIMSHSFQEQFDKINSPEIEISGKDFPRTTTDEALSIDLTQLTPPREENSNILLSDKNLNTTSNDFSRKFPRTHSDSMLIPKKHTPKSLKRFSSSKKIDEFLGNSSHHDNFEEDEFDRLVYGESPCNRTKVPEGINKLLFNDIESSNDLDEEITIDGRTYSVKTQNVKPKPDYERMDSPTRLKELYKFGLKPLKKKQAIIMLEYIYNQTHPYLVEYEVDRRCEGNGANEEITENVDDIDIDEMCLESSGTPNKLNKYALKDCYGSYLMDDDGTCAEKEGEEYIFQTNAKAKLHTALLPLHVAWFNLVKSNRNLRESILYYEPVDLQEIYVFLKSIGYRYEPKDMKRFFDRRSIIFQYDLNKEGSNRHVRKPRKQTQKMAAR